MVVVVEPINWVLTSWTPDGNRGWILQPVILVENLPPFYGDDPLAYIDHLRLLRNNGSIANGHFNRYIGEFLDCLDYSWDVGHPQREVGRGVIVHEETRAGNGHRSSD